MIIIRNCKFSENPRRIPLHVHLQCPGQCRIMPGQCRIVHRPCRSRGDECCRSRRLFVGKYPAERISILPSGASSKFHANRHIELTGPDQTAEGFGPGGRAWRTGLEDGSAEWVCGMEPSTISGLSVEGSALDAEPSMMRGIFVEGSGRRREPSTISGFSVEGSDLDAEPSMMRGVFVEGSGLEKGTFHSFGLQRGRFRSGGWTFHDAGRFRGGFGSAEWNLPRFRASAWMVPPNSLFRPTASRKYQR